MKNIVSIINNYIEAKLPDLPAINNDVFTTDTGNAIISRHDPSSAATRRFNDGSRQVQLSISYYARSKSGAKPREWLDEILEEMDETEVTGEGLTLHVEAATEPQFISVDDKNNTIYEATLAVEYLQHR